MKSIEMKNEKLFDTLRIVSHLESEYQLYRDLCKNLIIQSKTNVTIEQIFDLGVLVTKQSNISKKIANIESELTSIFGKYNCDTAKMFFDKNEDYTGFALDSHNRLRSILDVGEVLNAHIMNEHKGIVQDAGLN